MAWTEKVDIRMRIRQGATSLSPPVVASVLPPAMLPSLRAAAPGVLKVPILLSSHASANEKPPTNKKWVRVPVLVGPARRDDAIAVLAAGGCHPGELLAVQDRVIVS